MEKGQFPNEAKIRMGIFKKKKKILKKMLWI